MMTKDTGTPETTDHYVKRPGGELFARMWTPSSGRSPEAAPVILLHDSLGSVDLWRNFPADLTMATGRVVIAYDRLGFGRSSPHPGRLDLDFVDDEAKNSLPHLCAAFGLTRAVFLGHSVGGAMAAVAASRHPETCAALITIAAQTFTEDLTLASISNAKSAFADPAQLSRLARYHGDKAKWVLDAWTETWLSEGFATWRIDDDLRRIHCPVLAIHGDHDEYGSQIHPTRITSLVQGPATKAILEDCGHVPQKEKPEQVLDTIARFLAPLP